MPRDEATLLSVLKQSATTTDKFLTFSVTVSRPDQSPVVTGSVKLVLDAASVPSVKPVQMVLRATSGAWTLAVKGMPAGSYTGKILFSDVSKTHADSSQPVNFTIEQGPTPSASATPTTKPKPKPSVDGCSKQIKN
jgi:hypothetical protein